MENYALVTPIRDEAAMVSDLVATVDALEPRPALWLVIDDGSQDTSRTQLDTCASTRPWMEVVGAPEPSDEYLGGHIARIKRWGLEAAQKRCDALNMPVDFLGVLDADILLPGNHYAALLRAFSEDASLGIASSLLETIDGTARRVEPFQRSDLPRGPTQFFRKACLTSIGGLPPWPGFDGAANVKAQLAGWRTRIVPSVTATHRRPTATRFGEAPGFERKGRYAWFLGVHPLLVAARGVGYSLDAPRSAGLYFWKGWLTDALQRKPRCPDPDVRRANGWPRVRQVTKAAFGVGAHYARDATDKA